MTSSDHLALVRTTAHGLLADGDVQLSQLGELGLLGLLVPEHAGGMGWCPVEAAIVADELGRTVGVGADPPQAGGWSATSWVSVSVAAAALGAAAVAPDDLAGTLDGTQPAVAALGSLGIERGRATGSLAHVDLPRGVTSIVAIDESGSSSLVPLGGEGVTDRPDPTSIDTTRAVRRVDLVDVAVEPLGRHELLLPAARALVAAVAVGVLRQALERLVAYLSARQAFGRHVASFQAIQHRIVDLSLLEIRAGVAVDAAVRALAEDPDRAPRAAAIAHGFVMDRIVPALDECIQLTGGIGFTWEYPLHHELRRVVAEATIFGSARRSRERFLEVGG